MFATLDAVPDLPAGPTVGKTSMTAHGGDMINATHCWLPLALKMLIKVIKTVPATGAFSVMICVEAGGFIDDNDQTTCPMNVALLDNLAASAGQHPASCPRGPRRGYRP